MTVQSNELESMLAHIHNMLPYTPRWIAVITVDATVMGYYGLEKLKKIALQHYWPRLKVYTAEFQTS